MTNLLDSEYIAARVQMRKDQFKGHLQELINRYNIDDVYKTPDWILADHIMANLEVLDKTNTERDRHYGLIIRVPLL